MIRETAREHDSIRGGSNGPFDNFFQDLRVIAFDFDGVLFDSREANERFYNHIMEVVDHGPVLPEQMEFIHMHPVKESLRFLLGNGPMHDKAWAYAQEIDYKDFNAELRVEPWLVDMLQAARTRYRTALATNRTISAHEVLAHFHLDQYFDLVVTASDVQHPKPHPEAMKRIQQVFGVTPGQVLYVGDSPVDESFAESAGVYFAAYKNPRLKAHIHLDHFQELYNRILHPNIDRSRPAGGHGNPA
ncbi:MAG: HAD-IA family hydrolase [Syntrophobacteraceae bacterium]|nr:HAD-IA family hydrolase [Syntrophobacteraceae bacterium]